MTHGGQIEHCPHQECGFTCCDFAANNFIALYPGEIEDAEAAGNSLEHLEYSADGRGGHQAVCRAKERSTCDGGYKPLDCASYPFFPTIDEEGQITTGLKGDKCPLQQHHLFRHCNWVIRKWQELLDLVPGLEHWIRHTGLVGYSAWPPTHQAPADLAQSRSQVPAPDEASATATVGPHVDAPNS